MFFWLSKLFWMFAQPSSLLLFALAACAVGLRSRFAGAARRALTITTVVYALCAFGPVSGIVMRPLEDRFPRPPADMPAPDGIIVLGGAMDENVGEARHALVLDEAGSRMTEGASLARRYPDARLIFTGGSAELINSSITEAEAARRLFVALGVAPSRLVLEDQSRNTFENAAFTREVLKPRPDERFLLVTSGFHMPRAMGVFRRAGFNVIAWPADYTTAGRFGDYLRLNQSASTGLRNIDRGTREWVGLVTYRVSGMTDTLLPAP